MSIISTSSTSHSPAGKTVRLGSEYILDPELVGRGETSWFRKQSSTSFLEPAIDLARRLSVKINGPRGFTHREIKENFHFQLKIQTKYGDELGGPDHRLTAPVREVHFKFVSSWKSIKFNLLKGIIYFKIEIWKIQPNENFHIFRTLLRNIRK